MGMGRRFQPGLEPHAVRKGGSGNLEDQSSRTGHRAAVGADVVETGGIGDDRVADDGLGASGSLDHHPHLIVG